MSHLADPTLVIERDGRCGVPPTHLPDVQAVHHVGHGPIDSLALDAVRTERGVYGSAQRFIPVTHGGVKFTRPRNRIQFRDSAIHQRARPMCHDTGRADRRVGEQEDPIPNGPRHVRPNYRLTFTRPLTRLVAQTEHTLPPNGEGGDEPGEEESHVLVRQETQGPCHQGG